MKVNPVRPATKIAIGKAEFDLFYDFEAVALAESECSMPIISGITFKDIEKPRIALIRAMLYAGLLRHQPGISKAVTDKFVNAKNFAVIWAAILGAWSEFLGEPEEELSPIAGQN